MGCGSFVNIDSVGAGGAVDEAANYAWTGTHSYTGNDVTIVGAALVVPATTSGFQTTAGGIYLDGTTSGPNISAKDDVMIFRYSTTAEICGLSENTFAFPAIASFQWANNSNYASNAGTKLTPLVAGEGIIEQDSHTSNDYAQGWYTYTTKTNSTNYERFVVRTQSADVTEIGQEELGTGVAREVSAIGSWRFQGIKTNVETFTGDDTLDLSNQKCVIDATANNVTLTLPTAVGNSGVLYSFKRIDASGFTATIDGDGTEEIDGALTTTLAAQYDSVTIYSDGANWLINQ